MKAWIALLLLWASLAPTACACTCAPYPVEQAFAEADAVYIGRPREARLVNERYQYLSVVFEVESAWKGLGENVAVVLTPVGDGPCGFWPWDFDPQTRYLIYAENTDRVPDHYGSPPPLSTASSVPSGRPSATGMACWKGRFSTLPGIEGASYARTSRGKT